MNTSTVFSAKMGPGGKRNRANRRRNERRIAYHVARGHGQFVADMQKKRPVKTLSEELLGDSVSETHHTLPSPAIKVDLSGVWDENIAKVALEMFAASGLSGRAFAAEHNFPESRIRNWKKKLAA